MNHGIEQSVVDKALSVAQGFFELPAEEKMKIMSSDVHTPVRYGTSVKDGVDKIQFWRVFLKHYANPLNDWLHFWPKKPSTYRYIVALVVLALSHQLISLLVGGWVTYAKSRKLAFMHVGCACFVTSYTYICKCNCTKVVVRYVANINGLSCAMEFMNNELMIMTSNSWSNMMSKVIKKTPK